MNSGVCSQLAHGEMSASSNSVWLKVMFHLPNNPICGVFFSDLWSAGEISWEMFNQPPCCLLSCQALFSCSLRNLWDKYYSRMRLFCFSTFWKNELHFMFSADADNHCYFYICWSYLRLFKDCSPPKHPEQFWEEKQYGNKIYFKKYK